MVSDEKNGSRFEVRKIRFDRPIQIFYSNISEKVCFKKLLPFKAYIFVHVINKKSYQVNS